MKQLFFPFLFLVFSLPAFALDTRMSGLDIVTSKSVSGQLESGKKALVVTFLSAKCPCSDSHVTALKELSRKFPEMQYVAVHSNVDESPELTAEYFKKANLPFPVLQDEKLKLANKFGAYKTPHSFVVSPEGVILYQGGVSDSKDFAKAKKHFLEDALVDIQAGTAVRVAEGRTLGCVITRGDEKTPWSH